MGGGRGGRFRTPDLNRHVEVSLDAVALGRGGLRRVRRRALQLGLLWPQRRGAAEARALRLAWVEVDERRVPVRREHDLPGGGRSEAGPRGRGPAEGPARKGGAFGRRRRSRVVSAWRRGDDRGAETVGRSRTATIGR